jgi:dTDP-4-amino-4,6-dideoxygalactose transaminase
MYRIGQEEIDALTAVIKSGKLFRYHSESQCAKFEARYSKYLGVQHTHLCASGTNALTAGLSALGIGPGDEVVVPAHTYMASGAAVLAVGAIPVIADIDESITLSPQALLDACGPLTRAVIPVHMWGQPCDMDAIMKVAKKKKLFVIEDACQAVGGSYEGKKCGSIGDVGAFSFNYFKNMTCGEGGAIVTNNEKLSQRARCMIDCCGFYWTGRNNDVVPFIANGARASEFEGALLNVQLDRLPDMIKQMQKQKKKILKQTAKTGLTPARANSLDYECATNTMFTLPTAEAAQKFAAHVKCGIAGKTGRHTYTEWDQFFTHQGGPHPALNPFNLPQNKKCRKNYTKDMCAKSLDILNRTAMIPNHPDRSEADVSALIGRIKEAAKMVL